MASVVAYTGLMPQTLDFLEGAATKTFQDGDLVELHTDGKLKVFTAGDILGIARRDAEGVEDTVIPVELINPNEIYVVTSSGTTDQDQVGLQLAFDAYTAGAHTVAETVDTSGELTMVGLHPADGAGAGGRILVRFRMDMIEARTD